MLTSRTVKLSGTLNVAKEQINFLPFRCSLQELLSSMAHVLDLAKEQINILLFGCSLQERLGSMAHLLKGYVH